VGEEEAAVSDSLGRGSLSLPLSPSPSQRPSQNPRTETRPDSAGREVAAGESPGSEKNKPAPPAILGAVRLGIDWILSLLRPTLRPSPPYTLHPADRGASRTTSILFMADTAINPSLIRSS